MYNKYNKFSSKVKPNTSNVYLVNLIIFRGDFEDEFSAGGLQPRARAARDPGARWAGGSSHVPERCVRQQRPMGRGAPATRQSGASANSPQWARGPRPHARAELTSPIPGGRGTPAARQSGARAPGTLLA